MKKNVRMLGYLFVLVLFLFGSVAQAQMATSTDVTLVDGSVSPAGILDTNAYRTFYYMVNDLYVSGTKTNDYGGLNGILASTGLTSSGQKVLQQAALNFVAQDAVIVSTANSAVNTALASGPKAVVSDVQIHAQKDSDRVGLHNNTMSNLKLNLSTVDLTQLDTFIQTIFKLSMRAPKGQI
jgi:hypothetical protein